MDLRLDVEHVRRGLELAASVFANLRQVDTQIDVKDNGDPVTEADRAVNTALAAFLPRPGEAWLSEESVDDHARLSASRVWVVDPLDGTASLFWDCPSGRCLSHW